LAGVLDHCPATLLDIGYRTSYQVEQCTGTQVPQIVESFMFGMLSNSIKFRDIFMKVQMEYSPVSQSAQP